MSTALCGSRAASAARCVGVDHVVRAARSPGEVDARQVVADAGEGFESSHGPSLTGWAGALRTRPRRRGLARRRPHPGRGRGRGAAARDRRAGGVRDQQLEPAGGRRSRPSWPATACRPPGDVITSAMAAGPPRARRASGSSCAAGPGWSRRSRARGAVRRPRRRRRRGAGRLPPRLRLRAAAHRRHGGPARRPAARHERRRHLPARPTDRSRAGVRSSPRSSRRTGVAPDRGRASRTRPMAALVRAAAWAPIGVMVGDRPDTDGRFARAARVRLRARAHRRHRPRRSVVDPPPDLVAADLATLVDQLLGGAAPGARVLTLASTVRRRS